MRKFTLIFILFILFLSFAATFLYLATYKGKMLNRSDKTPEPVSTESPVETPAPFENRGPSVYEQYTKERYDLALKEKRVLVLYFTANWCEDCRSQDILNKEALESLISEGAVGLTIHILDSEATTETANLAKKFSVTKENTFVILDPNGAVFSKTTGDMSKEALINEIKRAMEVK